MTGPPAFFPDLMTRHLPAMSVSSMYPASLFPLMKQTMFPYSALPHWRNAHDLPVGTLFSELLPMAWR